MNHNQLQSNPAEALPEQFEEARSHEIAVERVEKAQERRDAIYEIAESEAEGKQAVDAFADGMTARAHMFAQEKSAENPGVIGEAVDLDFAVIAEEGDAPETAGMVLGTSEEHVTDAYNRVIESGSYDDNKVKEINRELSVALGSVSGESEVSVSRGQEIKTPGWDQIDGIPPKPDYAPTVHLENNQEQERSGEISDSEKCVDAALERAEAMAERGVERSEFAGEKVEDAIESYYGDQEVTLSLMESFNGIPSDEQLAEIRELRNDDKLGVESEIYNQVFTELETAKTDQDKQEIMENAVKLMYTEPCVGQLTLESEDIQQIAERKQALLETINPNDEYNTVERQVKEIESAQEVTRNEVRSAGQLLFHNTSFGRAIEASGGNLQGRFAQEKTHGESFKSQADVEGHSQLAHFSEAYDGLNYKGPVGGASAEQWRSETYAMPLAHVIEQAPIAGGLEMATVTTKDGSSFEPNKLKGANVNKIGAGEPQRVGSDHLAKDRVFWANGDTQESAANYAIPLNSENVYVLQSAYDRENSGSEEASKEMMLQALGVELEDGTSPESVSTGELLSHAYHTMREELQRYDKPADLSPDVWRNPKARGLREQVTEYINEKVAGSRSPDMAYQYVDMGGEKNADESMYGHDNEQITKIMEESAKKYEGQVVVPLRASGKDFSYIGSGDAFTGGDNVAQGTYIDRVSAIKHRKLRTAA